MLFDTANVRRKMIKRRQKGRIDFFVTLVLVLRREITTLNAVAIDN